MNKDVPQELSYTNDGFNLFEIPTRSTPLDGHNQLSNGAIDDRLLDYGLNFDWSKTSFSGKRNIDVSGEDYIMSTKLDSNEANQLMTIKCKYDIDGLSEEQKMIALTVFDTVWKFLTNDKSFKPIRATVMGAAGTGKMHLINTIATFIRELTGVKDSVLITAPVGNTRMHLDGCSLREFLSTSTNQSWMELSQEEQTILQKKIKFLQVLMIHERNLLPSIVVGATERNIRECAFGGQNKNTLWGGIPVVILFGDDYQIPPVMAEGAIRGYSTKRANSHALATPLTTRESVTYHGTSQLVNTLTERVFELTYNYRHSNPESQKYVALLERVRKGVINSQDQNVLINLHWEGIQKSGGFKQDVETSPDTTYLLPYNRAKDEMNYRILVETSSKTKNPVAELGHVWRKTESNHPDNLGEFHISSKSFVNNIKICVGAKVAVVAGNDDQSWDQYNGLTGTIIDIVYDNKAGPHAKGRDHLPKYIVLDIPDFDQSTHPTGPWDKNNPTVRTIMRLHFCFYIKFVNVKINSTFIYPARANTNEKQTL